MTGEAEGSALDLAVRRLERAIAMLESRMSDKMAEAGAEAGGLFDQDRSRLAADATGAELVAEVGIGQVVERQAQVGRVDRRGQAQRVEPRALLRHGFVFRHPHLADIVAAGLRR